MLSHSACTGEFNKNLEGYFGKAQSLKTSIAAEGSNQHGGEDHDQEFVKFGPVTQFSGLLNAQRVDQSSANY